MKISLNWLKEYIKTDQELIPDKIAVMLTNCGLEVEAVHEFQSVAGGLKGLLIGEVKKSEKHPNADKLTVTKVNVGNGQDLQIVCGAPNVEAGQKVVVATAGTKIFPTIGDPVEIKEAKIRGELSQGMICAEDEIGLGTSHEGIMVLSSKAVPGTTAREYFDVVDDTVFEIGLTPNRIDAASHIGVARDLVAAMRAKGLNAKLIIPDVEKFNPGAGDHTFTVEVEDKISCPRYSGLNIWEITVSDSPLWLKNRLKAIGVRPINNIVDLSNYVLHETGQPLHIFDADKVAGNKVIIKKLPAGTKFITLDEVERKLSKDDLMICNNQSPMCIAGVFGGISSGVTSETKNIFIESAYFSPASIRKTSKYHNLKTDASFRYERGADPNITLHALKRAALLIKEIAAGTIAANLVDVYPFPVKEKIIKVSFSKINSLLGTEIKKEIIKDIVTDLGMEIITSNEHGVEIKIPTNKHDVTREADIAEEVIRIYGLDNIPLLSKMNFTPSAKPLIDKETFENKVAGYLTSNGFHEIFTNSLTNSSYFENEREAFINSLVKILNPLSKELNVLRPTMLHTGLEAIKYNQNRQHSDLKFFEFGNTYKKTDNGYIENTQLSVLATGRRNPESWNSDNNKVSLYYLKAMILNIFRVCNVDGIIESDFSDQFLAEGLLFKHSKTELAKAGIVSKSILKKFDISQDVLWGIINWDALLKLASSIQISYKEISKYPEVRRDLSMLLDKQTEFSKIKDVATKSAPQLLRSINLFDVYEGDKIEAGKKSYAVSFILQDENKTLTDKQIDATMEKIMKALESEVGAIIRKQ
jgi:phenylalanyl-tRNA synthetase beta chain